MERAFKALNKPDWLGLAASLLAVAACYGTLAVLTMLSLMGATLTLHEGAWAGAIVFFALLSLAGIVLGWQHHGRSTPAALALAGVALIFWVMFAQYVRLIGMAGFGMLLGAAIWDWRLRKPSRQEEKRNG